MTRQKSERREVPQGPRKRVPTQENERPGGGKAAPVNERTRQLGLRFETAEVSGPTTLSDGDADLGVPGPASRAVPKSKRKEKKAASVTMEEVCERLDGAFQKVESNKGAAGPDGQTIEQVRKHWAEWQPELRGALLEGAYKPGRTRRVWLPKAGGGQRGLGIPDVIDRVVQEAVRQVLEPQYEPQFHPSSHGFRPERSCHTAIAEAREHLKEGYEFVVDIDLEKFFDKVNHQRLMARLAKRIVDRRVLVLIGRMLKAQVVMPNGVVVSNDEGVPQGGPLSPLLSNIVLDELDSELERRSHRFVRYADDCNIYVRSERAGQRVMQSVKKFIEGRMRLKVNETKSAVARPEERHFVGFRLRREPLYGEIEVLLSSRSKTRIDEQIRRRTPRTWGGSLVECILALNAYLRGWIGFFGICTQGVEKTLRYLDAHIRRRLRAIQLRHWKRKSTMARRLTQLGAPKRLAWNTLYSGRRSMWKLAHTPGVDRGLRNAYFAERGLVSLASEWQRQAQRIVAPEQLTLALG